MVSKVLKAAVVAACCLTVQAAMADEWQVEWQGFNNVIIGPPVFHPGITHEAKFSGVDANHDSILDLDELDWLKVNGREVTSCTLEGSSCGVESFSYSEAGGVHFSAYYHYRDVDPLTGRGYLTSYDYRVGQDFRWSVLGQNVDEWYVHAFTPQTIETVTLLSAVPEPGAYAMFGAGMLLLGASAVRRRPG